MRREGPALPRFLEGGGESGALMRAMDWSASVLGPPEGWPQSLRTAVSILLNSRYPMFLFWGPQLIKIYNDGYAPITGDKHPWALGRPGPEVWPEIWDDIGPMVERVVRNGEATWSDDLQLFMRRHGFPEEVFFTFSYSPIRDESGGIGGMFCACTETTAKVQSERRLKLLRDLAAAGADARTVNDACTLGLQVLAGSPADVPFALLYLLEDGEPRLCASAGVAPEQVRGGWPLAACGLVEDLAGRFAQVPAGPWPEPPSAAVVLPLSGGALVLGVSSRIRLDQAYRSFFELVAGQFDASLAAARASESERRRAEALAELDRAKTAFFSNVSHEFRTPLTLMLGPVQELLEKEAKSEDRALLEVVQRNAQRLLKLVNTLLDFARIEAGRAQASYEPTDLAALSAELASNFRSACERAGLRLEVDCPPLAEPAYVDREMWEKIVLNLISNAFKFTFEGAISLSLRMEEDFKLVVRDTGSGIPAAELPRMFERFHRVEGTRGRSHEGSGIGLALVQELVKLHGGSIEVESAPGKGSVFTVSLPRGSRHLPAERIKAERAVSSTAARADAYVDEALSWLPHAPGPAASPGAGTRPTVLVADDNADLRDYARRLLAEHYDVVAVGDGEAALAAARARRPDLVVSDVMMPKLDGIGLMHALRADAALAEVPVILLSARAGEEARLEGLGRGADAYLVKPFSARELLVRAGALLHSTELRRRIRQERADLGQLFAQTPVPVAVLRGPELVFEMANPAYIEVVDGRHVVGKPMLEVLPEARGQGFDELLREVMRTGSPHVGREMRVRLQRGGALEDAWFTFIYAPVRGEDGESERVIAIVNEVTEQVTARQRLEALAAEISHELAATKHLQEASTHLIQEDEVEALYEQILDSAVAIMRSQYASIQTLDAARGELRLLGFRGFSAQAAKFWEWVRPASESTCGNALRTRERCVVADVEQCEFMAGSADLQTYLQTGIRAVQTTPLLSRSGALIGMLSTHWSEPHQPSERDLRLLDVLARQAADAMERSQSREQLRRSAHQLAEVDRRKDEFIATLSHELRNPLAPLSNALQLLRLGAAGDAGALQEMMERQVTHLVRLTDDLLEMSRITRGAFELRRERVELAAIARNALETADPLIRAAAHQVTLALPQEALWVDGDPVRLAQIFANLLNNAARYTENGGSIVLRARREGASAVLSVSDNGPGIAPERLAGVFDMFSRGERSSGLGIGLALARRLAEMHGGTVEAASAGAGKGAEFTVRLPLAERPARIASGMPGDAALSAKRILVVDDNVDAADSLGSLLRVLGAEVQVVHRGRDALPAFEAYRPGVVLLDIGMPEVDGYEVARAIRSHPQGERVPLVALTGWGQAEDRRRVREAGFDHHLVKPAELGALRTLLGSL